MDELLMPMFDVAAGISVAATALPVTGAAPDVLFVWLLADPQEASRQRIGAASSIPPNFIKVLSRAGIKIWRVLCGLCKPLARFTFCLLVNG
jgi:hypothetical protein